MNALKALFTACSFLFLLASCGPTLTYFTQDLYNDNRWSENELKQIQFYLSHDIILKRQLRDGSSEIINGTIRMENGRRIEEVVIRQGTPGVLIFSPKDNRFAVSFEDGSEKRYLMFGPNPKLDNRYVLLASDWEKRQGTVQYDGKEYIVDARNALAALQVDLKSMRKITVNSRTAKGRRIN